MRPLCSKEDFTSDLSFQHQITELGSELLSLSPHLSLHLPLPLRLFEGKGAIETLRECLEWCEKHTRLGEIERGQDLSLLLSLIQTHISGARESKQAEGQGEGEGEGEKEREVENDTQERSISSSFCYSLLVLLIPTLEHFLRHQYVRVNDLPKGMLTAESFVLYTTLDLILSLSLEPPTLGSASSVVFRDGEYVDIQQDIPTLRYMNEFPTGKNKIIEILGNGIFGLFQDIFLSRSGLRLRDRLAHGEAHPQDYDPLIAASILSLFLSVCCKFPRDHRDDQSLSLSPSVPSSFTSPPPPPLLQEICVFSDSYLSFVNWHFQAETAVVASTLELKKLYDEFESSSSLSPTPSPSPSQSACPSSSPLESTLPPSPSPPPSLSFFQENEKNELNVVLEVDSFMEIIRGRSFRGQKMTVNGDEISQKCLDSCWKGCFDSSFPCFVRYSRHEHSIQREREKYNVALSKLKENEEEKESGVDKLSSIPSLLYSSEDGFNSFFKRLHRTHTTFKESLSLFYSSLSSLQREEEEEQGNISTRKRKQLQLLTEQKPLWYFTSLFLSEVSWRILFPSSDSISPLLTACVDLKRGIFGGKKVIQKSKAVDVSSDKLLAATQKPDFLKCTDLLVALIDSIDSLAHAIGVCM